METLELTAIQNMLVGTPDSGGMSFEQKKRLCIAIEMAGNPSILFLDEPTSGLDSRAAQIVIRCMQRVAKSGRAIVCTIHQPSTYIFNNFDSLLLLQRGGQTVFFGELGPSCANLVSYFESIPHVPRIQLGQNPATWMLEVIGAGTGGGAKKAGDFHSAYLNSALHEVNCIKVNALCNADKTAGGEGEAARDAVGRESTSLLDESLHPMKVLPAGSTEKSKFCVEYIASNSTQMKWLLTRCFRSYWRSPGYNFLRMAISLLIALIFGSVYANQKYGSVAECISRSAVIFLTMLFCGIVGMNTVVSVTMINRPAFLS
jgi:energy-coupling factor transporter ATP-binding protein EcfA2